MRLYGRPSYTYTSDSGSIDNWCAVFPLIATDHSLLERDGKLDTLLDRIQDEIEEHGEASAEAMERFELFCQAMDAKIDRIGRSVRMMGRAPNTARRSRQATPCAPRGRKTSSTDRASASIANVAERPD
jgi:hypothetical protein